MNTSKYTFINHYMDVANISKCIKIKDLRAMCASCNLDISGSKRDLRNRLELYQMNQYISPSNNLNEQDTHLPLPPPPPLHNDNESENKKTSYDRGLVSEQDYEYEKCLQEDREKELKKYKSEHSTREHIADEHSTREHIADEHIADEHKTNEDTLNENNDKEVCLSKEELREARLRFFS